MGTVTFRFVGTRDVRDLTAGAPGPYHCTRVYTELHLHDGCGHKHRKLSAAENCARGMCRGILASNPSAESWVEIRVVGATTKHRVAP